MLLLVTNEIAKTTVMSTQPGPWHKTVLRRSVIEPIKFMRFADRVTVDSPPQCVFRAHILTFHSTLNVFRGCGRCGGAALYSLNCSHVKAPYNIFWGHILCRPY